MSSSRNCDVTFPNVCRWSERSFWPFIKPCFSDSVLSSAGGDLCGAVPHLLPCLTNSFLFQKSPYQTQHSLPACCIFHLLRCVIYKHFYRISCLPKEWYLQVLQVGSLNTASGQPLEYEVASTSRGVWQFLLFPQVEQGKLLSCHFTPASASVIN